MNLFFNEGSALKQGRSTDLSLQKPDQIFPSGEARSLLITTKNELNTDKWPLLAVQINFQKSEKKTCHPLKCWIMPNPKPSLNLAKTMEKLPKTNRRIKIEFVRLASVASVGFSLLFVANTFAQTPPAA